MNQIAAAQRLGIKQFRLSRIESGSSGVQVELLQKMARLYGIPVAELLGEAGDQTEAELGQLDPALRVRVYQIQDWPPEQQRSLAKCLDSINHLRKLLVDKPSP